VPVLVSASASLYPPSTAVLQSTESVTVILVSLDVEEFVELDDDLVELDDEEPVLLED